MSAPPGKGGGRRPPGDAPNATPTTQAQALEPEVKIKDNGRDDSGQQDSLDPRDIVLYALAYGTGHEVGWRRGWAASGDEWQALLGVYQAAVHTPRHADIEAARQPSDEPCPTRCSRCSRCTRHTAVQRNRERYGTPDFPGGGRWTP